MKTDLIVGRRYVTRDGRVTGPVEVSTHIYAPGFPFQAAVGLITYKYAYTKKGRFYDDGETRHPLDLVKAYREKPAVATYNDASLKALAKEAYDIAVDKGFWAHRAADGSEPCNPIGKLLLIHSEVSEAAEELRTGETEMRHVVGLPGWPLKPEGLPSELADILIRTLDLAHGLGIDIEKAVQEKMTYNKGRPKLHGGKKF